MSATPDALVISCEHASNAVPRAFAEVFRGHDALLASHRGWDPGALGVAQGLATRFRVEALAGRWTRLLIELNRSPHHPALFSRLTRDLPAATRERLLAEQHAPHWERVRAAVRRPLDRGAVVLHLGVHSFTPELDGEVRNADVALLYDPKRPAERAFAAAFCAAFKERAPDLRVRRNYPYRGDADGLTTALRRELDDPGYLGIELELNQAALASAAHRRRLTGLVGDTLEAVCALRPRR